MSVLYVFYPLLQKENEEKMKKNSTNIWFCILSARTTEYIGNRPVFPNSNFGNVAQLVEQRPFKAKVPGSSPGIPTSLSQKSPLCRGILDIYILHYPRTLIASSIRVRAMI